MADLNQTSSSDSPPMQPPEWLLHGNHRVLYPVVILLIILLLLFLYFYISRILSEKSLRLNETAAAEPPSAGLLSLAAASARNAGRASAAPLPPVVEFSADERRECTVCLGELGDGERGRLLPRCGHGFHVQCIDTWLRSHSTCPVCRSPAVAAAEARAAASDESA